MKRVHHSMWGTLLLGGAVGCATVEGDFQAATEQDSIEAYQDFLKRHPNGEYASKAEQSLKTLVEERAWDEATAANTQAAYEEYLRRYPEGSRSQEARRRAALLSITTVDLKVASTMSGLPAPELAPLVRGTLSGLGIAVSDSGPKEVSLAIDCTGKVVHECLAGLGQLNFDTGTIQPFGCFDSTKCRCSINVYRNPDSHAIAGRDFDATCPGPETEHGKLGVELRQHLTLLLRPGVPVFSPMGTGGGSPVR
jgi:hypothetical protein